MTTPTDGGPAFLLDKKGREILPGDTLKVFHFIAANRRERCYMYKFVMEVTILGDKNKKPALKILHLSTGLPASAYYYEIQDRRTLPDYEIVQGYGTDGTCFRNRKQLTAKAAQREGELP